MEEKKVYKITFNQYTNGLCNAVWNGKRGHKESEYIEAKDLLIFEEEIEYYKQFGKGIYTLEYVGRMINKSA